MHYIYRITNMINGKVYLGQTKNPLNRWSSHKSASLKPEKYRTIISSALSKHGLDNFLFEIIITCKTQEDTDIIEEICINQYNSRDRSLGYNLRPGGETISGWHHSEETKNKISIANSGPRPASQGENNPFFGKHHSDESKQKIAAANYGKSPSEETRKKIGIKSAGRTYSDETKEKHRIYQTGKKYSSESKAKMSKAKKGRTWKLIDGKRKWM